MTQTNTHLPALNSKIVQEAKHWLHANKGVTVGKGCYGSPRVSSEIADCSMPLTFDQYNICSLGCMYCAVAGTKIATATGRRRIETLEVGEHIFSRDLEMGKIVLDVITSTMERTVSEILQITIEDGTAVEITPEHPVYVKGVGWKLAKDLKEGDDLDISKKPGCSYYAQQPEIVAKIAQTLRAGKNGRISAGEKCVQIALKSMKLNFIHQHVISKRPHNYILDFLLPDQAVCLEYDGHSKHYTKPGIRKDQDRDQWLLQNYGIRTIRIHRDQAFIPIEELCNMIKGGVGI